MNRIGSILLLALALALAGCHTGRTPPPKKPATLAKVNVARDLSGFVTSTGKRFVPFGVNYYRPGTGWAPQIWKKFDPNATREDFRRMKELGVNCVRVFLTYGSFYSQPGVLDPEGVRKFDEFLALAEEAGIYVHPTGPDHWEGPPSWSPVSIESDQTLTALESFWRLFASRYRGRNVIFAYDLKNEPEVAWQSPVLKEKWNAWLRRNYGTLEELGQAWHTNAPKAWGGVDTASDQEAPLSRKLIDYQTFREEIADQWTERQVRAIKASDPNALVTVGFIQWSVPALLPGGIRHYAAFRPDRQARFLDFLEVHFYPFASGAYEYRSADELTANLAYAESIVREVARPGLPVVLAEFGWYGGGKPSFDQGRHPFASEEQHAAYCRALVETTASYATGWLNWGFYDQPEARDCSELTGLLTADGKVKAWGRTFAELASHMKEAPQKTPAAAHRPQLDWNACTTSMAAQKAFLRAYLEAFRADK